MVLLSNIVLLWPSLLYADAAGVLEQRSEPADSVKRAQDLLLGMIKPAWLKVSQHHCSKG
jgi:hypothetical protein